MTQVAVREETRAHQWTQVMEWPLMGAALVFLVAYAAPIINDGLSVFWVSVCDAIVWISWAVFVVDYVARLALAPDRWVFVRSNLLDLAVVTLPMLRPLRLLRLVVLLEFAHRYATQLRMRVAIYAAGGATLLVFIGGLAITHAERGQPGANIANVGDGWWWAFVSMTTVGYGDFYPVTVTGRLVAVALMIAGIALLGSVTGMFASWMVEQVRATSDSQ